MNKIIYILTVGLISLSSLCFAGSRKGFYMQGYFGPSTLSESETEEMEIYPTTGVSLGYGLSQKFALAGTFNLYMLSTEAENTDMKYILLGGDILFFPSKNLGLFLGVHFGPALLSVSVTGIDSGGYTLVGPSAGPKIGYEFNLTSKLSGGIDCNYFYIGEATGTMSIGGSEITITSKDNGMFSVLLYLKYHFS